jgi:hypothetical protein
LIQFCHREIAKNFRNRYLEEHSVRTGVLGDNTSGMELGDLMNNWFLRLKDSKDQGETANDRLEDILDVDVVDDDAVDGNFDEDHSLPELPAYKEFISKTPAYEWLLQSIRRELILNVAEENVQANIRQTILYCLSISHRVSRKESPATHRMTFTLEWDPCSFFQEQEYSESAEGAVGRVITITGSDNDAQAATTAQYLRQTWPSTGIHLLGLVKKVVRGVSNCTYTCM